MIKRAILSVYNKTNIVTFAKKLSNLGVEIYSTGGTLKKLTQENVPVKSIEEYIQHPEILNGRVKTLHPKIHGGILARRNIKEDIESLKENEILTFDLVCINLYPFKSVIQSKPSTEWNQPNFIKEAIEMIDIGGPTMIRATAKNFHHTAIVVNPNQYDDIIAELQKNNDLSLAFKQQLALEAFKTTSEYETHIAQFFSTIQQRPLNNTQQEHHFPNPQNITLWKNLRYGENPHQQASFYTYKAESLPWECLHGKELSYNNLLDLDAAFSIILDFYDNQNAFCAIFKHTNPCGVGLSNSLLSAIDKAFQTDSISAFGGILIVNQKITLKEAEYFKKHFLEIIIFPVIDPNALESLKKKKNLRLIQYNFLQLQPYYKKHIQTIACGYLLQDKDFNASITLNLVTKTNFTKAQEEDLIFGFNVVKHIKSNAIVFVKDKQVIAIGAGQMSRIDSVHIAIQKAKAFNKSLEGSILASDAFFPFRDIIDFISEYKITGIIQPGGSINDTDSIQAADEHHMFMAFTGIRHFRH